MRASVHSHQTSELPRVTEAATARGAVIMHHRRNARAGLIKSQQLRDLRDKNRLSRRSGASAKAGDMWPPVDETGEIYDRLPERLNLQATASYERDMNEPRRLWCSLARGLPI